MSWLPSAEPDIDLNCPELVEMVIIPRSSDIGGFEVRRSLPFRKKRLVGPFIFWDQMGPGEFIAGEGMDVKPHPHIGLSTVTYLMEGSIDHRDSLGTYVRIKSGDVNLMSAGAGIVHSERTGKDVRQNPGKVLGIQSWVAQPKEHENGKPLFTHTEARDLPVFEDKGVAGRLILGEHLGLVSPVPTQWSTLYLVVTMQPGSKMLVSKATEERAIYTINGSIEISGNIYEQMQMIVLKPGFDVDIFAREKTHLMILGGAVMDGPRYIYWNFVSSSKERLEEAKEDWREQRFAKIPGDDKEFVPLPEY